MKLIIFLALLLFPTLALAHNSEEPILHFNGELTTTYTVGSTSLQDFILPHTQAPKAFLLNEKIKIELRRDKLPFTAEELQKVMFTWDFGDGAQSSGFSTERSFDKQGSYTLVIHSKLPTEDAPTLLEAVRLNIIPTTEYTLPSASFTANGQKPNNPYADILKADFKQPLRFDASASSGGSSPITSYLWDFGDGEAGRNKQTSHRYAAQFSAIAPLLRITTKDGFVSDSFAQIENLNLDVNETTPPPPSSPLPFIIGGVVLLLFLALARYFYKKK